MPLKQCTVDGKEGWQWGDSGHCYPGEEGKKAAIKQGLAEGGGHLNYAELKGVEIFAAGEHNGDKFTTADLDEMAAACSKLDFIPPLKQGHSKDDPGQPALGYVTNVRRVGDKLMADFTDMPDLVYDAIKRKSYNRVSSEVYFNLKRNGDVFKRALKAVALLGAEIPAVAGLAPLSALFKEIDSEVRVYTFDTEEESAMTPEEKKQFDDLQTQIKTYEAKLTASRLENEESTKTLRQALDSATATINLLVKKDRENSVEAKVKNCALPAIRPFIGPLYELAMDITETREFSVGKDKDGKEQKAKAVDVVDQLVAQINKTVVRMFGEKLEGDYERAEDVELADPGKELDKMVKQYQKDNKDATYAQATVLVMKENPELAKAYNNQIPPATAVRN